MLEEDLKIRQKEGTNELLKQYLSSIDSEAEFIYAYLFRPMNCTRCEARIPYFTRTMKQIYPEAEILLIAAHEDREATEHYLKKNNYLADHYLYDTNREYENIFSLNTDGLYSVYILKINRLTGQLTTGGDPLTLNKQFIHEMYTNKDILPYQTYESDLSSISAQDIPENIELEYKTFLVNSHKDYPISGVYEFPSLKDNLFIYSDELGNAGYTFKVDYKKNTIDFIGAVMADSSEKDTYVDMPEQEYIRRKENGLIFYIALDTKFIGENKIGISYSLPRLFMESPTNMAYYNQPVILVRDKETLNKEPLIPLDFDIFNETYMYTHFSFFPIEEDKVIVGCKKITWPLEVDIEDYQGIVEMDPFMEKFYETENPYFAIFDNKTGKLLQRFGQLDISQQISRTGYYYSNPIANHHKDKIVYGDGYIGKLYIADRENPTQIENEISVFDIDLENLPEPDPASFYKLEYGKTYDPYFTRCIESVILTHNSVECLIRVGMPHNKNIQKDHYEYISIDRNSNEIVKHYPLVADPDNSNERILAFGLAQNGENITPYYFAKNGQQAYINYIYQK